MKLARGGCALYGAGRHIEPRQRGHVLSKGLALDDLGEIIDQVFGGEPGIVAIIGVILACGGLGRDPTTKRILAGVSVAVACGR